MKRVLVADDNGNKVFELNRELEHICGYDVTWVDDGKKAREAIERQEFDAAVLDQRMPPRGVDNRDGRYNGDKIAIRARERNSDMAIVLYSTDADDYRSVLEPLGVFCYNGKGGKGYRPIIDFLKNKLGE